MGGGLRTVTIPSGARLRASSSPLLTPPHDALVAPDPRAPWEALPVRAAAPTPARRMVPVTPPGALRGLAGRPLVFLRVQVSAPTSTFDAAAQGARSVNAPSRPNPPAVGRPPASAGSPPPRALPSAGAPRPARSTSPSKSVSTSPPTSTPGARAVSPPGAPTRAARNNLPTGAGRVRFPSVPRPARVGTAGAARARVPQAPGATVQPEGTSRRVGRLAPPRAGATEAVVRWFVAPPVARERAPREEAPPEPAPAASSAPGRTFVHPQARPPGAPVAWRSAGFAQPDGRAPAAPRRSLRGGPLLRFLDSAPARRASLDLVSGSVPSGASGPTVAATPREARLLARVLTELGVPSSLVAPAALLAAVGPVSREPYEAGALGRAPRARSVTSRAAALVVVARKLGRGASVEQARAILYDQAYAPPSGADNSGPVKQLRRDPVALAAVTRWLTSARAGGTPAPRAGSDAPRAPGAAPLGASTRATGNLLVGARARGAPASNAAHEPLSDGVRRVAAPPPIRGLVRAGLVLATAKGRRKPEPTPPRTASARPAAGPTPEPSGARRRWRAPAALGTTGGAPNDTPTSAPGTPSRTRWRAPEAAMPAAPAPPAARAAAAPVPPSALTSLSEAELIGVLRTMASRSPEARTLLQDVREQVEALERADKMRRLR
jgi:hypothetical protein